MAMFVHFFRMTPAQFWDLDAEDYDALGRYLRKWHEANSD